MKFLNVAEIAEKWQVNERMVRNYCSSGRVKGAKRDGKTWLIPENVLKPARISSKEEEDSFSNEAIELLSFIDESPVNYFVIENALKILKENGYKVLKETDLFDIKVGDKVCFVRNGTSLIALNIGSKVDNLNSGFHIVASHSDSPCFKIKPNSDSKTDIYNKINVEPYGGMICSTWLDRPLSVAGRVLVKEDNKVVSKLLNIDENLCLIPNLCIHFSRDINNGHSYNMAVDMQAFLGQELEDKCLIHRISNSLKVKDEDIVNFDLSLYNRESSYMWGKNNEYISSSRLDDQECVFTSLKAFVGSENNKSINVCYIADNEEVGSSSASGADGDFLESILARVCSSLKLDFNKTIASSFLISADNAHAVHPNFPSITDSNNKCYMNKGIAIKFNASQRYTSDAFSSSVFQELCKRVNSPYQLFTNRSDIAGGSTLGNILLRHISMPSVDIGLPQLAMHSSFETAGSKDVSYIIKTLKEFYSSSIIYFDTGFEIE